MAKKDMAAEVIRLHGWGMAAEAIAKYLSLDVRMVEWVLDKQRPRVEVEMREANNDK